MSLVVMDGCLLPHIQRKSDEKTRRATSQPQGPLKTWRRTESPPSLTHGSACLITPPLMLTASGEARLLWSWRKLRLAFIYKWNFQHFKPRQQLWCRCLMFPFLLFLLLTVQNCVNDTYFNICSVRWIKGWSQVWQVSLLVYWPCAAVLWEVAATVSLASGSRSLATTAVGDGATIALKATSLLKREINVAALCW